MLNLSQINNLAITGANGFVGRSIVEKIATLPAHYLPKQLSLVTRFGLNYEVSKNIENRISLIEQDLTKSWSLPTNITHLITLAADGSKRPYSLESCEQFERISDNLIDWVDRNEVNLRIFHASTGACFGNKSLQPGGSTNVEKADFIQNRIDVEDKLVTHSHKVGNELSIGRLFSFSGRNILSKPQYAITSFITSAVTTGQILIHGNPQTIRSYLHQDSMSEWILAAVVSKEAHKDLQIGSNDEVSLNELAEYVAEKTGAHIRYSDKFVSGDIYIPNNNETRIKLGVNEGLNWKEAVLEMISDVRVLNHGV